MLQDSHVLESLRWLLSESQLISGPDPGATRRGWVGRRAQVVNEHRNRRSSRQFRKETLEQVFMMFLISEVHPFADGNGRIARVMMNAELVAAGENRIIVPTVYRNNYLMAVKALSQNGVTGALVRVIDFAQKYTAAVDFSDLDRARLVLDRTHAFADPNEADAAGVRLRLPTPDVVADVPQN